MHATRRVLSVHLGSRRHRHQALRVSRTPNASTCLCRRRRHGSAGARGPRREVRPLPASEPRLGLAGWRAVSAAVGLRRSLVARDRNCVPSGHRVPGVPSPRPRRSLFCPLPLWVCRFRSPRGSEMTQSVFPSTRVAAGGRTVSFVGTNNTPPCAYTASSASVAAGGLGQGPVLAVAISAA